MKRLLDQDTLRAMARGCAVLGAGGGGDTYYALLQALQAAEVFGPAALVDVDELPGDGLIMPCGGVGAPLVGLEKIEAGDEGERLRDLLQRQTGQTVTALMAGEIGGGNGLVPVTWAVRMGLPVVDADGMGRAFPLVSQVTMELAGISPCPAVMTGTITAGTITSRLSRSGCCLGPGQADGVDFFGGGLAGNPGVKLRGDQDPPQLCDHVDVGGAGLGGVPGCPAAAVAGDSGAVPGQVVPDDHDALGEQREGDGALHGARPAVAGLAGAGDVLGVTDRDLDGPAASVTGDDLPGGGGHVGGDQDQPAAGLGDRDHADRAGPEHSRPQAAALADGHARGLAVPGHGDGAARAGGGELGRGADPGAFGARPAPLAPA